MLPKWSRTWIFLITAAKGKHTQIWKITLYWCTEVCGSGSLTSPGMTRRWDSLLFLWLPGIKVSFLLLKIHMNKSSQGNRLLISPSACLYKYWYFTTALAQRKSSLPHAPFAELHTENILSMKPMGNSSLWEAEEPKPSHPNSSKACHILQPLQVPSIFHYRHKYVGLWLLGPGAQLPAEPPLLTSSPLNKDFPLPKTAALAKDSLEAAPNLS